jgi:transposase-like protein
LVDSSASARWAAIVEQHEQSGQTIRAFAAQHGLNPQTLSWWRWKVGRTERSAQTSPFVEVSVHRPVEPTVVLAFEDYRAHIVVDQDTDLELLRKLLAVLC